MRDQAADIPQARNHNLRNHARRHREMFERARANRRLQADRGAQAARERGGPAAGRAQLGRARAREALARANNARQALQPDAAVLEALDEINGIDFDDEEVPNRRDVRQDPQVLEFANLFPRLIALDPHDAQLANQNLARMARHLAPENYIRVARREQRQSFMCGICKSSVHNVAFLNHLDTCAASKGACKIMKDMEYHHFLSSTYSLRQQLYKLRERLELEYFEARVNPERLEHMECAGCITCAEHLLGACMPNMQRDVYQIHANKIEKTVMAHFEQFLELTKEDGLGEIISKHTAHFDSIQDCIEDGPTDFDELQETQNRRHGTWYEFRKDTVEEQQLEKNKYLEETIEKHLVKYRSHRTEVTKLIGLFMDKMLACIEELKNSPRLARIIQLRRVHCIDPIRGQVPLEGEAEEIEDDEEDINAVVQAEEFLQLGII